jgi:hypothetical protein
VLTQTFCELQRLRRWSREFSQGVKFYTTPEETARMLMRTVNSVQQHIEAFACFLTLTE